MHHGPLKFLSAARLFRNTSWWEKRFESSLVKTIAYRAVAEPKPGRALRLPKEWGDCRVYVFGEPGAKFKIVEYADSEFVEAPST